MSAMSDMYNLILLKILSKEFVVSNDKIQTSRLASLSGGKGQ